MRTTAIMARTLLFMSCLALALSLIASWMTFRLAFAWENEFKDNRFVSPGTNAFEDSALRYLFIAVLIILPMGLLKLSDSFSIRVAALPLAGLLVHQCIIVVWSLLEIGLGWAAKHPIEARLSVDIGKVLIVLACGILAGRIVSIWLSRRSTDLPG